MGGRARLGASTRFVGKVGDDDEAAFLRAELARAGVDVTGLRSAPGRTRTALVLVDEASGERGFVSRPESHAPLGAADLTRDDVRFINRQRGAGTRVLLDYELKKLGVKRRQIQGYERQEFTHLAVAAAVQSGLADCGLGILAAARALGLDCVPLVNEQYDLVIPREY